MRVYLDRGDSPYSISGLSNYLRYQVRARAWNALGYGPWSVAEATPTDPAASFLATIHQGASFSYYDLSYTVEELSLQNGELRLRLDKDVPPGLRQGGYLRFHVNRSLDSNPQPVVLTLPGDGSDFAADPRLLKWTGVDWTRTSNTLMRLYTYQQRDPQIRLSVPDGTRNVAEGGEIKVRVALQPQDKANTVTVTLTGDARLDVDYTLDPMKDIEFTYNPDTRKMEQTIHPGWDVLPTGPHGRMPIRIWTIPASQTAQTVTFPIVIAEDAESEDEEIIRITADVGIPSEDYPRVNTSDYFQDRRAEMTLNIPENMGAPAGLSVRRVSGGTAAVTWSAPAGDGPVVTGYEVEYKESDSDTWLDAGSAAADPGGAIWSATLTVRDVDKSGFNTSDGCDDFRFDPAEVCSSALTNDRFTFGGAIYEFTSVLYNGDRFQINFLNLPAGEQFPDDLKGAALKIGDTTLYVADAKFINAGQSAQFNGVTIPGWAVGATVNMALLTDPHEISGLADDVDYDVRARAVSALGPGPWATLVSPGTPEAGGGSPGSQNSPGIGGGSPGTGGELGALPQPEDQGQPQQSQPQPKTFSVTPTASAVEGASATLTVTLSEAAPADGVTVAVIAEFSGHTAQAEDVGSIVTEAVVSGGSAGVDIAIPLVDDNIDEGDETFAVTVAVPEGWSVSGLGADAVTVTIRDNDTAGVSVTPTALNVAEDGSVTYTVVLDSQPTADVTVTASSGDGGAAGVTPASLTFAPSGWNIAQTFTVSGVADDDRDDESVGVNHSATSQDRRYDGIAVSSVAVAVSDTTPEPQQPVQQEPEQQQVPSECMAYDTNGNGTIDADEAVAAAIEYDNGDISRDLLMQVLNRCR